MKLPRLYVCGLAGLAWVVGAASGATAPLPEDLSTDVVRLPPMIVEGKNRPLPWRYLAVLGMEMLTVCNDYTATEFMRRSHRLNELLRAIVPDRYLFKSTVPEIHILFNEETGRARSEEVIREMVRAQGAQVASNGTVLPGLDVAMPEATLPGIARIRMKPRRYLFLPNLRLSDHDSLGVFSIIKENERSLNFTLTDDRVEYFLTRRAPALPDWLIEGLLGVYRRSQLLVDDIRIKPMAWPAAELSSPPSQDPTRAGQLLPMAELLVRRRPKAGEELGDEVRHWQAQCTLFVQWTLAENNPSRRAALWHFVDRQENEPLTDTLFEECFGICFSDMLVRLRDYLPEATSKTLELAVPKGERLPKLKSRPATDLEVARIRGDWERLEIDYIRRFYPDMVTKYVELARATLRRAYDKGERDPRLLVSLGLTELEAGDLVAARGYLEAAATGGMVRPRAGLELARLRYAEAPADGKLNAAQVGQTLEPLLLALGDSPPLFESYVLLATVWNRSQVPPGPGEIARLNEGVRLFPQASAYVLRVILFNVAGGQIASARTMAETGLRHAWDDEMRQRFERVMLELTVLSPSP